MGRKPQHTANLMRYLQAKYHRGNKGSETFRKKMGNFSCTKESQQTEWEQFPECNSR